MSKPRKDKDGNYPVRMVLAVEGVETSDGRTIRAEALDHRTLPLSVMGLTETSSGGHLGAKVTGRLDRMERVAGERVTRHSDPEGGTFPEGTHVWLGYGVLFPGTEATDRWLQGGLRGNSVDLTAAEAELTADPAMADDQPAEGDERKLPTPPKVTFTRATIAATTLCPVPAFEDAYVEADLGDEWGIIAPEAEHEGLAASLQASMGLASFRAAEVGDWCSPCAAGELDGPDVVVAGAPPVLSPADAPPADAFSDPQLDRLTRLTITEGREVIGHIAGWRSCHTSYTDRCVPPPRSYTDYAVFHGGSIRAQVDGRPKRIGIGQLTVGGGHAPRGTLQAATEHYDNVATAWADVAVGEDRHGIWVHGVLRDGVDAAVLRQVEAAKPSGDWRRYRGQLELMAIHCVNVAGYPVLEAYYDDKGVESLVAAGALEDGVQVDDAPPTPSGAVMLDYDILAERIASRLGVPFVRPDYSVEDREGERTPAGDVARQAFDRNPWKDGNKAGTSGTEGGKDTQCSQDGCTNKATKMVLPKGDGSPAHACDEHEGAIKQAKGAGSTSKALEDDGPSLAERRRAALEGPAEPEPTLAERRDQALLAERRTAALAGRPF